MATTFWIGSVKVDLTVFYPLTECSVNKPPGINQGDKEVLLIRTVRTLYVLIDAREWNLV